MSPSKTETLKLFVQCLNTVPDPRSKHGTHHPFSTILAIIFLGLIGNRNNPTAITRWTKQHFNITAQRRVYDIVMPTSFSPYFLNKTTSAAMNDKNTNLIDLIFVRENKVNEVDVFGGILLLRLCCLKNEVEMRASCMAMRFCSCSMRAACSSASCFQFIRRGYAIISGFSQ